MIVFAASSQFSSRKDTLTRRRRKKYSLKYQRVKHKRLQQQLAGMMMMTTECIETSERVEKSCAKRKHDNDDKKG